MEIPGSAVLTPKQKEQRAERAAKVKNHIKETVAEENLLLGQEKAVRNHAGDLSQLSPEPTEEGQAGIPCPGNSAETTPVLFKSRALESSLPGTSSTRRTHHSGRRVLFNTVELPLARKCSRHLASETSGEPSEMLSLAERGELHAEQPRGPGEGPASPCFHGSSSPLDPGQRSPPESPLQASQGGSGDITPTMSDLDSAEQGRWGQSNIPGETQQIPSSFPHSSGWSSLDPLSPEGVSDCQDSPDVSMSCAGVQNEEMEEGKEDPDPAMTPGAIQRDGTVPDGPREGMETGAPPSKETSGEGEGHSSPPLGGVVPSEGVLSSCTVVEGLMFPLEYYVRMTRRLSRHQEEVNLEAVIQSQLGKGRKGRRATRKEQAALPIRLSQELPKTDDGPSSTPRRPGGSPGAPALSPKSVRSSRSLSRRSLRLRRRTQQRTSSNTDGGRSPPVGSPGPASPALRMVEDSAALPLVPPSGEGSRLSWLPPSLPPQDFYLPDEDFGRLKSEKLRVCPEKPSGVWDVGGSVKSSASPPDEAPPGEEAASGQTLLPGLKGSPSALSSRKLLLSPALEGGRSLSQTPDFPLVGATPASLEPSPSVLGASPLQAAGPSDPGRATVQPRSPGAAGINRKSKEESVDPLDKLLERGKEPPRQSGPVEEIRREAPAGTPREGNLELTSKLKNGSGSCLVDMSTVWWGAADFVELCVVTAEETSISLWRPLELGQWGTVHTWPFAKLPVLQIVPLSGAHSVVCAMLGRLETAEIRLLFHSSEDGCAKEELLKAGNINAVLGLTDRKLVSSCWSLQGQEVEIFSFSEMGRSHQRWALMPPEETVLAFADVAGLQEALLGMTAMNCIVLWNLGTGQLLSKIPVGWSFPASVCHKAYSDSGLLFLVFSHPHAKDSQQPGNPAFQVVALNPKTARSSGVTLLTPPPGIQGRYLERDVKGSSAAAVLTSGTIAVWDLFLGQCTALLPPISGGSWSLARWSVTDACLLAGQEDGSVYLYRYTGGLQPG
ncbi:partner and localizer of BRCA2 isoform X2 [Erythrolamprus reginae]|uniref:partner and localizer of BRCA2 isoform X2 n=1 Tax=Erythrolamprus reginae TaxID=121349 RepID=UPI00396CC90E